MMETRGLTLAGALVLSLAAFAVRMCYGPIDPHAFKMFFGVFGFIFVMSWFTAIASVGLSPDKRMPSVRAVLTFPIFSLILSSSVLYTLIRPTRRWKPIPHGGH